jgi:hypothetical protein
VLETQQWSMQYDLARRRGLASLFFQQESGDDDDEQEKLPGGTHGK